MNKREPSIPQNDISLNGRTSSDRSSTESLDVRNISLDLTALGLNRTQANIYIHLLSNGTLSARRISQDLGLHRVDVYRKLHELETLGVVEFLLGFPNKYSAIDPKMAISSLYNRAEARLDKVRMLGDDLKIKLNRLKTSALELQSSNLEIPNDSRFYKLVSGRESYYHEVKKLVRSAKSEVLRIVSANGVRRTFGSGLFNEYVLAKKRGISLKMISEITTDNRKEAKRLSKVLEVRHLTGLHLRFVVVDRKACVISARYDENNLSFKSQEDDYLLFGDAQFAEAMSHIFEYLWGRASPVKW